MKRKVKRTLEPDVRPLDQRFNRKDPGELRKGMIKKNELVNRSWLEKEQDLFMMGL